MTGKLIIITAPSGAGKTSIVKYILQHEPRLRFSVSATTRAKREGETDGRDYYFISAEKFKQHIAQNQFAEYEEVYPGKYYGTLKFEIERIWQQHKHVLFDIDVKGALNLCSQYADNSLSIFVQPPSVKELQKRLETRHTETEETIKLRVEKAALELTYAGRFNHIIVNDVLETAQQQALVLIKTFLDERN